MARVKQQLGVMDGIDFSSEAEESPSPIAEKAQSDLKEDGQRQESTQAPIYNKEEIAATESVNTKITPATVVSSVAIIPRKTQRKTIRKTFVFPEALALKIKSLAEANNTSENDIVNQILENSIK